MTSASGAIYTLHYPTGEGRPDVELVPLAAWVRAGDPSLSSTDVRLERRNGTTFLRARGWQLETLGLMALALRELREEELTDEDVHVP